MKPKFTTILESERRVLHQIKSHAVRCVFFELKAKCWSVKAKADYLNRKERKQAGISDDTYYKALEQLQLLGLLKQSGEKIVNGARTRLWLPTHTGESGIAIPVERYTHTGGSGVAIPLEPSLLHKEEQKEHKDTESVFDPKEAMENKMKEVTERVKSLRVF